MPGLIFLALLVQPFALGMLLALPHKVKASEIIFVWRRKNVYAITNAKHCTRLQDLPDALTAKSEVWSKLPEMPDDAIACNRLLVNVGPLHSWCGNYSQTSIDSSSFTPPSTDVVVNEGDQKEWRNPIETAFRVAPAPAPSSLMAKS